jgi:hypothetical protein
MKTWKQQAQIPGVGLCTVKELTDLDATRGRRQNLKVMPISTGFVCLYINEQFVGVCGSAYALARVIVAPCAAAA